MERDHPVEPGLHRQEQVEPVGRIEQRGLESREIGHAAEDVWIPQRKVTGAHFGETEWYEDGDEGTTWSAHLRYQYFVKGQRYLSSRFTWRSTRGLPQREAYALLQGLRRGMAVIVHYDPRRPGRAVVFPGVDGQGGWYPRSLIAVSVALSIAAFAG